MDILDWRILIGLAFFVAGWLLGRVDMEQVVARVRGIPDKVSGGIARLMRGERAAAAHAFIEAAQPVTSANLELHLIAAELHRQEGRHDDAIRIHKHLLATPELTSAELARTRFELGLDYQGAGFTDLAAECFRQLDGTEHAEASLDKLLNLYIYSRNWQEAIENEDRFASTAGNTATELRRNLVAQLYCEWAVDVPARRAELLDEALRRDPGSVRARIMLAEMALDNGDGTKALATLEPVLGRPDLLPLTASTLLRAHAAAGNLDGGARLLCEASARMPDHLLFARVCDALAAEKCHAHLKRHVTQGLRDLDGPAVVRSWLESARHENAEVTPADIDALLTALGKERQKFTCRSCGFSSETFRWQCPSCREWETMLGAKRLQ